MIIDIKKLTKTFIDGDRKLNVLKDINLQIEKGSIVTIKGPSGSGKSTLLSIIGTLDSADSGDILINGKNIRDELNIDQLRNKNIGFVFQFHNLISELTLEENVCLPKMIANELIDKNEINELFEYFNLENRMNSFPNDLSGGEKQRVAVMRAIINNPSVIIADEPTGNLDQDNAQKITSLFQKLNTEKNLTIIIATHDESVFNIGHKKYHLVDGFLKIS
ncbi:MAG: lipoprotein-releasing system ATP-binding protein LolD [Candidatus Marinimicrobia bacterium]|nr:lipoprotein-releasing system ATP-binding protein LolD [Candidatus Neomarinimicrobiota bacterium]|tara:strand:+ start:917 stop:1576 length:660 start_codon:yes stop_codon:yes gene_type:complete